MTMLNIIKEYKDPFVNMLNQFLDSLYGMKDKDDPDILMYERLRRSILDGIEPTKMEQNLLLILTEFYGKRFETMAEDCIKASQEFYKIKEEIEKILIPKS